MNCNEIEIGGVKMFACGRGGPYCSDVSREGRCRNLSEFQCDFPIGRYKSGKKKGEIRDCNKHLCADHAFHGVTPGVDFCREHITPALEAYKRRLIKERYPSSDSSNS